MANGMTASMVNACFPLKFNDRLRSHSMIPPPIKQVIKMLVPRVNTDGNEQGGVPTVLHEAVA